MSPAIALPESLDLSHHMSKRVRAATPSAMKAMGKLMMEKNLLSLAGGMPHASLFPMQHSTFTIPTLSALSSGDVAAWQNGTAETETFHLKKTGPGTENDPAGILDLNQVLQYGLSNGFPVFIQQLAELNELVHGKATADASVYISCGNTDGVSKVFQLLVEPDVDTVLTEEYSFGSSLNSGRAKGAKFYPIKTDDDGLVPEDLDRVLTDWDENVSGRKPHLLYTIPCGQNPTGSIQPPERYDAIYAICQEHDVIIMEDDPYFPLQYSSYEPNTEKRKENFAIARARMPAIAEKAVDDDARGVAKVFNEYAGVKSYLSRDVDGRVVRIDTFSKVFGPGMRTGWVSANSVFVERLLRIGESTTQVPNNLAQAVLSSYLSDEHWGISGWIRWMWAVRLEYQLKRDYFLDRMAEYVPIELATTKPCGGGMFQWISISISKHPRYKKTQLSASTITGGPTDITSDTVNAEPSIAPGLVPKKSSLERDVAYTTNTGELMDELWQYMIEEGNVLLLPAKVFQVAKPGVDGTDRLNYFRATFAGDLPNIDKALKAFGTSLKAWFNKG